jgi:hypothetical protein
LPLVGCSYTPYSPPPVAFSGDSVNATQTAIVPTLDTPAPKGKNVIWCGTGQQACDELRKVVGKVGGDAQDGPWARLNNVRMNPDDLPAGSFYAAAGEVRKGIVKKIQSDMAAKFPKVTPNLGGPDIAQDSDLVLAYAYLAANVKFGTAYAERKTGDSFVDSTGKATQVSSFSCEENGENKLGDLAGQIGILYSVNLGIVVNVGNGGKPNPEFILDLDRNSKPSQIILASVEPKETLAATWRDVQQKIKAGKPEAFSAEDDLLIVPNLNFRIQHRFKELEGELKDGNRILRASQSVDFRLDRSGAVLTSEAFLVYKMGIPRQFCFTRPFLIVMRKRGAEEPYFVMWVDNAELLCKQNSK